MQNDPRFSHPQQRINKSHFVDCVGPFSRISISYNISLPCKTDPYSSFTIEIGAPDYDRVGSATSVMAPILALTRSAFFQQYDFDFDPCATLHTEFRRLAKIRKWKQGSNSKTFEKAWDRCFGSEVPVGYNIDERRSLIGAQYDMDNKDFSSVMHSLQSLDLGGGKKKRARRVGVEFASHYGSDARVTERWQALCRDCGINPVPPSITQCKKVQPP